MKAYLFQSLVLMLMGTAVGVVRAQDGIRDESTRRAVEVITLKPGPYGIEKYPLLRSRESGFYSSNLPRVKDREQPSGSEPVQAVNVRMQLVGDDAMVRVSVYRGKRFAQIEEPVASFTLKLGEERSVPDLQKYGFETIKFRHVASDLTITDVPVIINPAALLKVSASPLIATVPSYEISIANDSQKGVMGIAWLSKDDGRRGSSALPRGQRGSALIAPGGTYKVTVWGDPGVNKTFIVEAVIYDDDSFDGDEKSAGLYFSFVNGEKAALEQTLAILRAALATSEPIAIADLAAKIDSVMPKRETPAKPESLSRDRVTVGLLKELQALAAGLGPGSDIELHTRLTQLMRGYEAWLGRLTK
jgi:hypothetical protein